MVFSDLFFIFAFLPAFMLCYMLAYLVDKKFFKTGEHPANVRNAILVLFSLIFYAWGEPIYVFLMLFSVMVNYFAGLGIDSQQAHRKRALVIGLICNILLLGTFKYAGFFATTLNSIGIPVGIPKISLPIGHPLGLWRNHSGGKRNQPQDFYDRWSSYQHQGSQTKWLLHCQPIRKYIVVLKRHSVKIESFQT